MKTRIIIFVMLLAAGFSFQSCKKDAGFATKKQIIGKVTYPSANGTANASGARVTIKFGATSDPGSFDYAVVADNDGNYKIGGLNPGDYFLKADYTCKDGMYFSCAGAKVTLGGTKGDNVTVNLDLK